MDKCKIYNSAANINAFAGICCWDFLNIEENTFWNTAL
jgi:hypothetical protein